MTTVIVFAKAPVAGLAKTRLAPALGSSGAAHLAERLLRHTVQQAVAAGLGMVELCVTPDATHSVFAELALMPGLRLSVQGEGDIGQRMAGAFQRVLSLHGKALLIGTDAPLLDATVLQRAAAALDQHDAVFGPTADGGYVLVGLRRIAALSPLLFEGMRWSHAGVMAETRLRLAAAGLSHTELPLLHDIDEPADLVHVPRAWLQGLAR